MDGASDAESLGRARRLLAQLAVEGARLREAKGSYALLSRSSMPTSRAGSQVAQDLVSLCVKRDWLERDAKDLVLSAAGRAWLRRLELAGDRFREQHQLRNMQLREIDGARRPVLVNEGESPLGWLKSRKGRNGHPLITDCQYQAGERLRADYWFAQLSQRVTANWSALAPTDRSRRSAPSDAASLRDDVIAAKERVWRALEWVGPELSGVLIDIYCELKGLEEAEKSQGWPQRAGNVVLRIALSRLARHYGLGTGEASERRGGRRMRHWGSEDYRPTLDAWRGSDSQ